MTLFFREADIKRQGNGYNNAQVAMPEYDFRASTWFKQKVEQGKDKSFSEVVLITPALAKIMLERNENNRKIKEMNVNTLIKDIKEGRWQVNGEAITFSKDGTLTNGQHRCYAVIHGGVAIKSFVTFGLEHESRTTVDLGTPRKTSDILSMGGHQNATTAAACCRLLIAYEAGAYVIYSKDVITKREIADYYYQHEELVKRAIAKTDKKIFKSIGKSPSAAAYAIIFRNNPYKVDEFFTITGDGEGLKRGDAILQLRNHALDMNQKRYRNWEKLELMLRYYNSWVRDDSVNRNHSLRYSYPEIVD